MLNRIGGVEAGAALVGIGRSGTAEGAAGRRARNRTCQVLAWLPAGCGTPTSRAHDAVPALKLLGALAGHTGRLTSDWSCNKLGR